MILLLILLGLAALAGLPLFLTLSGLALAGLGSEGLSASLYFGEMMRLAGNPTLAAVPLFCLSGYLLASSGAPGRLVRLAEAMLGWLPGGLAIVAVGIMALLTAFTGASGVTIVALGGLMLPSLLKSNFSERFSLGLLTASGSIGLLFAPSLPLILYGIVAEVPIDRLFLAGVVPGLLMVAGTAVYSGLKAPHATTKRREERVGIWSALKGAIWEAILPIIVLGGIYGGLLTVGEAAVVTTAYLIVVEVLIYRDIRLLDLPRIVSDSAVLVGGIMVILGAALALTNYLIYADIPTTLLEAISSRVDSRVMFLVALNLFLLITGCLMDVFSALVVVVPLILPLAMAYGVDPMHLGIIFLANLEIGYSTPPVGLNLFIASFRFERPITDLYRAALPFLAIQLAILFFITYIPSLSLALPKWFGG